MTTVITRLYEDMATARSAADALLNNGHDAGTVDIIAGAEGAEDRMKAARVNPDAAALYAPAVADGKALVVVRAPFAPIGTARNAMKVVDRFASIKVGVADEDEYIRETPSIAAHGSIMADHPLFMSNKHRRLGPPAHLGDQGWGLYVYQVLADASGFGEFKAGDLGHSGRLVDFQKLWHPDPDRSY